MSSILQNKSKQHYNEYPFDFLTEQDESDIESWQPAPFKDFVAKYVKADDKVIDVGCGPGRATMYLYEKGFDVHSFDLSTGSIGLSQRRAPHNKYICGTNLSLPLASETFDVVVSHGVIHHTRCLALFRKV